MTPPHPWRVTVLGDRRLARDWLYLPSCDAGALVWVADEGDCLLDPWACGGPGDCVAASPEAALTLSQRDAA